MKEIEYDTKDIFICMTFEREHATGYSCVSPRVEPRAQFKSVSFTTSHRNARQKVCVFCSASLTFTVFQLAVFRWNAYEAIAMKRYIFCILKQTIAKLASGLM